MNPTVLAAVPGSTGGPGRRRLAVLGLPLAVAVVLAGCSTQEGTTGVEREYTAPTAESDVDVVQPGLPGAAARTLAPGEEPEGISDAWTETDVAFVQGMVSHHRQAMQMSALAPDRAGDPRLASLAERIRFAQEPEVEVMADWLVDRDQEVPAEVSWLTGRGEVSADAAAGTHDAHSGHGAGGEHGMATTEEVRRLEASDGEAFDALYVDLMLRHHEGALAMVEEQAVAGTDVQVGEMVSDISAVQTAEMRHLESLRPT